jgi:hypothetical protein
MLAALLGVSGFVRASCALRLTAVLWAVVRLDLSAPFGVGVKGTP